ncbi:unnamed protein product [Choristocarpus tenellus]
MSPNAHSMGSGGDESQVPGNTYDHTVRRSENHVHAGPTPTPRDKPSEKGKGKGKRTIVRKKRVREGAGRMRPFKQPRGSDGSTLEPGFFADVFTSAKRADTQ